MTPVNKIRIHSVDALRGFALAGIVIAHVLEQFFASMPTDQMQVAMLSGPIDYIVDAFSFWVIRGKFFALFSLLFGLSFFIQMDNAEKIESPWQRKQQQKILERIKNHRSPLSHERGTAIA